MRSAGLTVTVGVLAGVGALLFLIGGGATFSASSIAHSSTSPEAAGSIELVVALLLSVVCGRALMAGIDLADDRVVVRSMSSSRSIPIGEVAGLASQPIYGRRAWRVAAVTTAGEVVDAPWTAVRRPNPGWLSRLDQLNAKVMAASAWRRDEAVPPVEQVLAAHGKLAEPSPDLSITHWQSPPGWQTPPRGWMPPPGWWPPRDWPAAPPDWQWWRPEPLPIAVEPQPLSPETVGPVEDLAASRWLKVETVTILVAFLVPALFGAIAQLVISSVGGNKLNTFKLPLPGHPAVSLIVLIISYLPTAAVVPITLLCLARTGQSPRDLGLTGRGLLRDIGPSVGLLAAVFAWNAILALISNPLLHHNSAVTGQAQPHVPHYYVVYGLLLAATTAIAEEVVVNGYLLTRFAQLGWRPWPAFAVSLVLRTSYHLYYGLAFFLTVPFGWLVTRSFQKRGRLARAVFTHFGYDAIQLTVAVLTG